ncbi:MULTISPECIES: hypothetical protein [unclassified Brevibacterium]|uniref:hypothetical protein n=1 Tax=unclassified Brevibacterium TaxID=2614124 RepID=UPI001E387B9C|nr:MULTISPECIES: hypothetical protein [unclassified Brevibacterium]MCD1287323.1 hypothetical protein [Brevibacterium sp. CCUG 69071]MDK8436422.1 hypothetical protein [Brevibacterium sp. H-BE7]
MIIRNLTAEHLGKTVTLPTLAHLGRCARGTLHTIILNKGTDTSTLTINDHEHVVPNGATIHVTTEVSGL